MGMGIERAGTTKLGGVIPIYRMGYGAMRLCGPFASGWCEDRGAPERLLRRAAELGINFIDTADSYGPHINEEQIADALAPYPPGMVIATKGSTIRRLDDPARRDYHNSPAYLRAAVDGSLHRLKLEQIPLYQLHRLDGRTPLEDSLGALADLRQAGKIGHVGLSEVDLSTLATANAIVPIASVQNRFNIWDRRHADVVEWCEANGATLIPWSPTGGGMRSASTDETVKLIAAEAVATSTQVALAWLLAYSPAMLLIPGTASVRHLEENLAACDLRLDASALRQLDALG